MALKPGSVADFGGSLAAAMETAMANEWQAVKGVPLPDMGVQDRRLLFVAIARGLFTFLKDHENELISEVRLEQGGTFAEEYDVTQLELNL
jgi:hypothetical protein